MRKNWIPLGRALWILLALNSLALFILTQWVMFQLLARPSDRLTQGAAELGLSFDVFKGFCFVSITILFLVYFVVALLIFLRRPNDGFALFASIFLLNFGATNAYPEFAEFLQFYQNPPFWYAIPVLISTFSSWPLLIPFLVLYPDGQLVPRWVGLLAVYSFFLTMAWGLFPNAFSDPTSLLGIFGAVSVVILTGASFYAQFWRYRHYSSPLQRQQTKWFVFALAIFLGFTILRFFSPSPIGLVLTSAEGVSHDFAAMVNTLSFVFIPIAVGFAILRYRLWDIDLIINRTLVYGTLTTLVIGLYVFVVGYLGAIFRTQTNLFISLTATGVVAVLFQPLRDRLQRGVNRLMYGQRDEPVAVLSQLGARLEATLTPDAILPGLVDTVAQTLKLPYVAIALQVGGQLKVQAERGQTSSPIEAFPLIYQGQPIGQLWVAPRAPGEGFNPADRLLLTNIAHQAGAVAHAVRLTAALQQSRQQLVAAREEERRRLRRDLHDGLGPQLASQTLTLNAISKLLERDPAKARELLDHLKSQSQAAIEDIRRLVYALRPPALDELGLVAALHEGARQYAQGGGCIEITTAPNPLPALPAAVEVAVYRIVQEAITNVIRHTQAKQCWVAVTVQDHHLDLTIADDGPGFPPNFHFGVGLNSMRERAEELGGHLRFDNQPDGGARVQLWLPLPGDEE